jgi:hypothetical protein
VPVPTDAQGNFILPTSPSGVDYYFLWDHAAQLGQTEKRGVTVIASYVDAPSSRPDFEPANGVGSSFELFARRTIGRELGTLAGVNLRRESTTDPESNFLVDAILIDRGGDRERTEWAFEYAVTSTMPQEADWARLENQVPNSFQDEVLADGSIRSNLTFRLDPLEIRRVGSQQIGFPFGVFDSFWIRLQHSESFPRERDGIIPVTLQGPKVPLEIVDIQIGAKPEIITATVVDPGNALLNAGDPSRPWLRVPVTLEVRNPSSRRSMWIEITGRYSYNNVSNLQVTPFQGGDPTGLPIFELAPSERRNQFFLWNVARDEGLGIDSPLQTASVSLLARRVQGPNDPTTAIAGGVLVDDLSGLDTTLNTSPFVNFRSNLLPSARRVWSSGDTVTNATRDLFFTLNGFNQESVLGLNQQFEPLQIIPPRAPIDLGQPLRDVVATDFDPGIPDCLVQSGSQFSYVTWPPVDNVEDPLTVVTPIGSAAGLQTPGRNAVAFTLGEGSQRVSVAVFHSFSASVSAGRTDVSLRLTTIVRDSSGVWTLPTSPDGPPFVINGSPTVICDASAAISTVIHQLTKSSSEALAPSSLGPVACSISGASDSMGAASHKSCRESLCQCCLLPLRASSSTSGSWRVGTTMVHRALGSSWSGSWSGRARRPSGQPTPGFCVRTQRVGSARVGRS